MAGVDYILASPKVIAELARTPSASGYNDGMSAVGAETSITAPGFSMDRAMHTEIPKHRKEKVDAASFERDLSQGICGQELTKEGLSRHVEHVNALRPTLAKMTTPGAGA